MKEDEKKAIDWKELCNGCEICWETTEEDGNQAEERNDRMQSDRDYAKKVLK